MEYNQITDEREFHGGEIFEEPIYHIDLMAIKVINRYIQQRQFAVFQVVDGEIRFVTQDISQDFENPVDQAKFLELRKDMGLITEEEYKAKVVDRKHEFDAVTEMWKQNCSEEFIHAAFKFKPVLKKAFEYQPTQEKVESDERANIT